MRSSTSSSNADPVALRPVPAVAWPRTALVALALFVAGAAAWEACWRSEGYAAGYRNSDGQWAEARRQVDRDEPDATVLIGSSRMLFDIDLDVWKEETGVEPVQLALEGSNPLPVLTQISEDEDFDGLLVVGITPPLIMMPGVGIREAALERYETETPAQWIGQQLSYPLEPVLAFYNLDAALFTVLARQGWWPKRPGFEKPPEVRKLSNMRRNRQSDLWSRVETDSAYNDIVTGTWRAIIESLPPPPPEEVAREQFEGLLQQITGDVERIRDRGGEVVFVRLPSSGFFREAEARMTPREGVWDVVVATADAVGVHFEDYPELADIPTPEWSHVSARDKDRLTRALVRIMRDRLAERGITRPELEP
jgi:hypothetical protein